LASHLQERALLSAQLKAMYLYLRKKTLKLGSMCIGRLKVDSIKEEMFDMGDKTPKRPPKKKKIVKKVTVQPTIETETTSVKKPKK
jgi:hypothetical protein